MAELKGKRLIIAAELQEGMRLNTSVVKQLCSTDPIFAEKKFKAPFSFEPSHTLVLYTNHLPKVAASDDGTWRRLIVIPFHAKIEGAMKVVAADFKVDRPQCVLDAIKCAGKDLYVGTKNNKLSSKTNIEVVKKASAAKFVAVYDKNTDSWFLKFEKAKNMALNCYANNIAVNKSECCVFKYTGDATQGLLPVRISGNKFYLKSASNPGVVLNQYTSKVSGLKAGTNINFYNYTADVTQQFILERV